jgi:hypothetical protein
LTIAESVLLRHGALAAIRDSWDKGSHMAQTSDGSRAPLISPPGVWGMTMTLQGYINSWYNAEGTHGMHSDGDLANARAALEAAEIVRVSQLEESRAAASGMPVGYYKDLMHKRRTAAEIVGDPEFEEVMLEHAALVALDKSKFAWSAYSVYATGTQNPVPPTLWKAIESNLSLKNMDVAMTSKKALVMSTAAEDKHKTDMACLAFSLPLVMVSTTYYNRQRMAAKSLMTETQVAYTGGSALAAFHKSLAKSGRPCSQIINKSHAIEKLRIIAMMNMLLRWAAAIIEVPCQHIIEAGREGMVGYTLATSALMEHNKHKVMADMRREGFGRLKADGEKNANFSMVPIMNDCSGWGPYKNLVSVYTSLAALGPKDGMLNLLRLAFKVFMVKQFVTTGSVVENKAKISNGLAASDREPNPTRHPVAEDMKTRYFPIAEAIIEHDRECLIQEAIEDAVPWDEVVWNPPVIMSESDSEDEDEVMGEIMSLMERASSRAP